MIIFLNRVKLNMTLMVTAAGPLCRSGVVFFLIFCHIFALNFKTVHVHLFCDVV